MSNELSVVVESIVVENCFKNSVNTELSTKELYKMVSAYYDTPITERFQHSVRSAINHLSNCKRIVHVARGYWAHVDRYEYEFNT